MKWLFGCLLLCLVLIVGAGFGIIADGLHDRLERSDVAVVLGSKVMPDGTPSPRLQARLDRAIELYHQDLVRFVLVSGGTGKEGFSEGQVMGDYVVSQNVPASQVIVDEVGNTTRDTAINAARLMRERGLTSAIAVSQYFHITRSRFAFRDAGIARVGTAHAYYVEARDVYSIAREIPALAAYWLGNR